MKFFMHHRFIKSLLLCAAFVGILVIIGCGEKTEKAEKQQQVQEEPQKDVTTLLNPDEAELNAAAPSTFTAKFETSEGDFLVKFNRSWSPNGVDRVYYLIKSGFYEGVRFFRVIDGFMAQFGYHGNPDVINVWSQKTIPDDPVVQSNLREYVTFAKSAAPNSRSTQLFINYVDNSYLDQSGFSPIGKVVQGMEVVDNLYSGYGEGAPRGTGPSQQTIQQRGNEYLNAEFPELDYIEKITIVSEN